MDNKATKQEFERQAKQEFERQARLAFRDLRLLGTADVMQLVKMEEFCKPLKLTVSKTDEKIIVIGDKVGVLATFELDDEEWVPTEESKLTYEEYETYTDPHIVATLMDSAAAQASYGQDAIYPDGLIPIEEAVEIYSRGTDVHGLIVSYLKNPYQSPTLGTEEVNDLLCRIDVPDCRMLTALVDALDNYENAPSASAIPTYRDFLMSNPFGADKLVHALCLTVWTINHEEDMLLGQAKSRASLKELILRKGSRYTEAARKVAGKAFLSGAIYPVILLKVAKIRSDYLNRPTYLSD